MNKFVCCLCGKECEGWGNDPYPLDTNPEHECCDDCNEKVISARIAQLYGKDRGN